MKSVTLRIAQRAAGQAGYEIRFYEGPPTKVGKLIKRESLPDNALSDALRAQLQNVRDQLLSKTTRIANLESSAAAVGRLLLPGAVGKAWFSRMAKAQQEILSDRTATADCLQRARVQPGTRTYLHIAEGVDLQWIPWEIARADGTLFLQSDAPISRFHVIADGRKPFEPEWEIRILIVASARNMDAIGAAEEVQAIQRVLRPLDRVYDVLELKNPSRQVLTNTLKDYKPHVLHVIAHGDGDDVLLFDGAADIPWDATAIKNDLANSWVPEVAYLNACRSQDQKPATVEDQRRQGGIVDTLLRRGVRAVVAMQADVRGSAAGMCAAEFYRGLRMGEAIDVATARGRAQIAQAVPGREDARDPYLPVLTLTVPADDVLRHRSSIDATASMFLRNRLSSFVNRFDERRRIVNAIEDQQTVIVLDGATEMGKSWLLCWTIDLCLRREYIVRYLELGSCNDWLEVLRALRDGNKNRPGIQDPLGPLLKSSFNWKLTHLANGVPEPAGGPQGVEVDRAGPLSELLDPQTRRAPPGFEARACQAFHEALDLGPKKLVIVLDQLEASDFGLSPDQFILLNTNWIDPLVAKGDGRVQVLLAIRSERRRDYGLEPIPADYRAIPIDVFQASESKELLKELFRMRIELEPNLSAAAMLKQMDIELADWADETYTGKNLDQGLDILWGSCLKKLKGKTQ